LSTVHSYILPNTAAYVAERVKRQAHRRCSSSRPSPSLAVRSVASGHFGDGGQTSDWLSRFRARALSSCT
jgi:hypothetical protein